MSDIKLKQDDLIYLVSKKLDIPEQTVEFIIKDFFQQVRVQFKEGNKDILLDRLLKFKFKKERLEEYKIKEESVTKLKDKKAKDSLINKTSNPDNLSELINN